MAGIAISIVIGGAVALAINSYRPYKPYQLRKDLSSVVDSIKRQEERGDVLMLDLFLDSQSDSETVYFFLDHFKQSFRYHSVFRTPGETELASMLKGYSRLWLLVEKTPKSDPGSTTELWFDRHAYKVANDWHGPSTRLCLYAIAPSLDTVNVAGHPHANLSGLAELDSYYLAQLSTVQDKPPGSRKNSQTLVLALIWRALQPIRSDYTVFVQLLDSAGRLRAQIDREPVDGFRPTSSWKTGELVKDNYGLQLPNDIVPGRYRLIVGMYDLRDHRRLTVIKEDGRAAGDFVTLGTVEVLGDHIVLADDSYATQ